MKVGVIGTGYVGLVVGTGLAELGNDVLCGDVDGDKIAMLQDGRLPIYEPGLLEMVRRNTEQHRLRFSTDIDGLVSFADLIFIAVGTPPDEDGSADLKHVLAVARTIGRAMNGYKLVVIKSTVPVGTAYKVRDVIAGLTKHEFDVASNPEFLKEGAAVNDFMHPPRVVIGTDTPRAEKLLRELYAPLVRTNNPIVAMDVKSSEMTKYASNAMLATRISFMNEIAELADRVGADISMVRRGMGADPRIGNRFLFAGVGYGGSCFPKDVKALISTGMEHGVSMALLNAVEAVNARQKGLLVDRAKERFGSNLKGRVFGLWGLAFKPNTDDMREAPAITIARGLHTAGAEIKAYDPEAMENARSALGDTVQMVNDMYDAAAGVDALMLVTEWLVFREPDFERLLKIMKTPVLFDGRNIYNPVRMKEMGFEYYGIGRGNAPGHKSDIS